MEARIFSFKNVKLTSSGLGPELALSLILHEIQLDKSGEFVNSEDNAIKLVLIIVISMTEIR